MRILITGATYHPALNGQAIFTVNLAEGLAARGHELAALYPELHDSSGRRNHVRLEAVRSLDLTLIEPSTFPQPLAAGGRVRQVLDDFRPEIVHIQDHYPLSVTVVREAKRRGLKTVGTNHFNPRHFDPYIPGPRFLQPPANKLLWRWMLHLYRQLDFVTAPSQAAVTALRAQGLRAPTQAVSCGIDLKRFHAEPSVDREACRAEYGLSAHGTVFIYVGRLDRIKRIDVLVRAMASVRRADLQLAIAGQGALWDDLHHLAQTLGLAERVRFLGRIPNAELPLLLNSADVFVTAGDCETLSIASLEAMACARPLLLADAGALPELVTPGVNGYLFRPGDPVNAATYMERLADERQHWARMGRASLERAQPHSLELTLRRYETLYVQALEAAEGFSKSSSWADAGHICVRSVRKVK